MKTRARVAVVGAGPVGVIAAYRLATFGIDTVLIDANTVPAEDMRASTFHPPTLEMMAQLGILDELIEMGLKAPVYQYRNRKSGEIMALDLGELADETPYPFRLQCEQFKLSRLLCARLAEHPHCQVLLGHRALTVTQDANSVTIHAEGALDIKRIDADYLIAADGASSTIRKWLDIEFEGFTWPERFLTLSTRYPIEQHHRDLAYVNYVADDKEWCVLLRVPEFWRVLVPTTSEDSDESLLSEAKKSAVFDGLMGSGATIETHHRTLYRVHQRVAKSFRKGRILLAGDAAHLNNPLGGFGMNSGIHDVWNLTGKLRDILLDGASPDPLLDRYDRQRRTICTEFVQTQTIENKKSLELNGQGGPSWMERKMHTLLEDEALRRAYLRKQAMIDSLELEGRIA